MAGGVGGILAAGRKQAVLAGGNPQLSPETAREMALVTEPALGGNQGDRGIRVGEQRAAKYGDRILAQLRETAS